MDRVSDSAGNTVELGTSKILRCGAVEEVQLDCGYRLDILVEDALILELKTVTELHPIHEAQLLTYLRLDQKSLGLLINFNVPVLQRGVKRVVRGDLFREDADRRVVRQQRGGFHGLAGDVPRPREAGGEGTSSAVGATGRDENELGMDRGHARGGTPADRPVAGVVHGGEPVDGAVHGRLDRFPSTAALAPETPLRGDSGAHEFQ